MTDAITIDEETAVRTILYHEVSHLILTPCEVLAGVSKWLNINFDILNIFEDERIETILRTYYMRTDFKKFIKLVCKHDTAPKNAMEAFFNVVRFREGKKEFVDMVQDIIDEYHTIDSSCNYAGCTVIQFSGRRTEGRARSAPAETVRSGPWKKKY